MSVPVMTIVMPAYNAAKFIKEAIDSILHQSFSDFILLIINDASEDETEKIILSYTDKRIKYVKNEANVGIAVTLNKGIALTNTEYLVRMDADDIALPGRFQQQLDFMNANPGIGVCGSLYETFGNETGIRELPLKDSEIKANLLFESVICHPAVIMRTEVLKKNFAALYAGITMVITGTDILK